jgi:hypothetical protein
MLHSRQLAKKPLYATLTETNYGFTLYVTLTTLANAAMLTLHVRQSAKAVTLGLHSQEATYQSELPS